VLVFWFFKIIKLIKTVTGFSFPGLFSPGISEADAQAIAKRWNLIRWDLKCIRLEKRKPLSVLEVSMSEMRCKFLAEGPSLLTLTFESQHLPHLQIDFDSFCSLQGSSDLKDPVINLYLALISARHESVFCASTFFCESLSRRMSNLYQANRNLGRGVNLFTYSLVFFPVHHQLSLKKGHWSLIVVDMEAREIRSYNSTGTCDADLQHMQNLKKLLSYHFLLKAGVKMDPPHLAIKHLSFTDIPRQAKDNHHDCGVFVCKYAEYLSRKANLSFTQSDMGFFRFQIMLEIVNDKLMF